VPLKCGTDLRGGVFIPEPRSFGGDSPASSARCYLRFLALSNRITYIQSHSFAIAHGALLGRVAERR